MNDILSGLNKRREFSIYLKVLFFYLFNRKITKSFQY